VTLAPAVRWTREIGRGELNASLAVPLLAWVDRPFSDVRYANQFVDFRYASPAQMRAANGAVSYTFNPRSRWGVTAVYRADAMQLHEAQPVRRFTQSLALALTTHFGVRAQ
jgi:hypothetical protein